MYFLVIIYANSLVKRTINTISVMLALFLSNLVVFLTKIHDALYSLVGRATSFCCRTFRGVVGHDETVPDLRYYNQSKLSVTAPNEAELTSLAYFANTPRV